MIIRQELAKYGPLIEARGLTAGAGGNISARDGRLIWIKPSGYSMAQLTGPLMCGVDLATGRRIEGTARPSSELPLHLAIYKCRPDIQAIFHTHSPWASGAITSGADIQPMFAEVVNDLGNVALAPYLAPGGNELASTMADLARNHDTLFMAHHGVVALGRTLKQAYYRCCVAEDAAKSLVAAKLLGQPRFLDQNQIAAILGSENARYRTALSESPRTGFSSRNP